MLTQTNVELEAQRYKAIITGTKTTTIMYIMLFEHDHGNVHNVV